MSNRTAAFLKEMGITPLWVPRTAAPELEAVPQEPAPVVARAPAPLSVAEPVAPLELTEEQRIARMGWTELEQAIAACTRCGACAPGTKPVMGTGSREARWVVAAGAASAQDHKEGVPLSGDAGVLLANMLAAAGVSKEEAWVTSVIKCRPATSSGADRAPTQEEAAACRPFVEREVALTGAGTLLTLGQVAANAMLGQPLSQPLAQARGLVHQAQPGVKMVATLHPAELLRRGQDKALAWADLCLAANNDGPPA